VSRLLLVDGNILKMCQRIVIKKNDNSGIGRFSEVAAGYRGAARGLAWVGITGFLSPAGPGRPFRSRSGRLFRANGYRRRARFVENEGQRRRREITRRHTTAGIRVVIRSAAGSHQQQDRSAPAESSCVVHAMPVFPRRRLFGCRLWNAGRHAFQLVRADHPVQRGQRLTQLGFKLLVHDLQLQ
jgi:hypothetical protein